MMISPEGFIEELKNSSYKELLNNVSTSIANAVKNYNF